MTGLEHYREAERLLAPVPDPGHVLQVDTRPSPADVALAQVHATLALADYVSDVDDALRNTIGGRP